MYIYKHTYSFIRCIHSPWRRETQLRWRRLLQLHFDRIILQMMAHPFSYIADTCKERHVTFTQIAADAPYIANETYRNFKNLYRNLKIIPSPLLHTKIRAIQLRHPFADCSTQQSLRKRNTKRQRSLVFGDVLFCCSHSQRLETVVNVVWGMLYILWNLFDVHRALERVLCDAYMDLCIC